MQSRYHDWIDHHARNKPNKLAIADIASGRRLTYGKFNARIASLASFLSRDCAIGSGDRVCVIAKSCVETFEIQFACARIGAIFLPVNWRLTLHELEYIVGNATPAVLLCEEEFAEVAGQLVGRVEGCRLVEFAGGADKTRYERGIAAHRGSLPAGFCVDMESTWLILYTSGTTGHPKGAMLSYRMMLANVLNFGPACLTQDSVFLCAMPTFHTGGLNCYSNPVFHAGGTVLVMREFDPALALTLLEDREAAVTHFFGTPAHYLFISQQSRFDEADFPALRIAGLGGAPSSDALVARWLKKGVPLQPAYGMTEIGPAILICELDRVRDKIGSAGQPVMHIDFKIATSDGREVPVGEVGEIWVKGPVLMSGYWKRPDATAEAFSDGWFRTGDAAYRDEDGFVFIVDRLKDMFISGGENVYPVEVENVICAVPGVSAAAVVGVPDPTWGEVGRAFVIAKDGDTAMSEAIIAHCQTRLAKFKIPKSIVFVDDLPRTASGKVLKRDLRALSATSSR